MYLSRVVTSLRYLSNFGAQIGKRFASNVLVLAEQSGGNLNASTLSAITAARQIPDSVIHVVVAGSDPTRAAQTVSKVEGVNKVLVAKGDHFEEGIAENFAPLLSDIHKSGSYSHIMSPATVFGKSIMPRLAASLDCTQISDIIKVVNSNTFVRSIYAGSALATVESSESIKIITVRPSAFEASPVSSSSSSIVNIEISHLTPYFGTKFVSKDIILSERPELSSAKKVVSGGRGVKSKENFQLIENLADAFGAAVGASRAAVDAGYCNNDYQVGQTGKIVAPDLYCAVGISGAIQHVAGMKDSKIIVSINKDKEAPIFSISDYGLVGDLFTIVPEMIKEIKK